MCCLSLQDVFFFLSFWFLICLLPICLLFNDLQRSSFLWEHDTISCTFSLQP
jgi:hypothetical protein